MTVDDLSLLATIFGALVAGALIGLIPGIIGYRKGKRGLAIGGFAACVVGSFLMGLFLSIPMCILFTVLIFVLGKKAPQPQSNGPAQAPVSVQPPVSAPAAGRCAHCGKPVSPGTVYCPSCGTRQPDASSSLRCPSCGAEITPDTVFCSKCGMKLR